MNTLLGSLAGCAGIGFTVLFGAFQFTRVVRWFQRPKPEGEE